MPDSLIGRCDHCGSVDTLINKYNMVGLSQPQYLCRLCSHLSDLSSPILKHISFVGNTILLELKKLNSTKLRVVESIDYTSKFYYKEELHRVIGEGGAGAVLGISCCVENIQSGERFTLPWGTIVREVEV